MMKRISILAAIILMLLAGAASAQVISSVETAGSSYIGYRLTSTVNTSQVHVFDTSKFHDTLAIHAVCSAGTATLIVDVSVDNTNFLTIDSLTAASPQVKQYVNSTVGAAIALSPLSWRYIRLTVGTCGGGNSSTLTVAAK